MATDRFIYFGKTKPPRGELRQILTDFIAGGGQVVEDADRQTFLITLTGPATYPLRSVVPQADYLAPKAGQPARQRFIEVWLPKGRETVNVLTRQADDFTIAVAGGIVELLARYYEGKTEDPATD